MHAMVGNSTGETYRLGDRVTAKLVEAAPVAGALRFELLSEGRIVGRTQQRPSQRRPAKSRPERGPKKHYGQRRK
jgi:ribonuclease R